MIKDLIQDLNNIEKDILKVMIMGFRLSFCIYILSAIILLTYIINPVSHIIYESGILLFKAGIIFKVAFFICAFATDKIKKELI